MKLIKEKISAKIAAVFSFTTQSFIQYDNDKLDGINYHGITDEFEKIQPVEIAYGRYLNQMDFDFGTPNIVIGYENAEMLFGKAEKAVGKAI